MSMHTRRDRERQEPMMMKPIGLAFAAVVAGLGAQAQEEAPAAPALEPVGPAHARAHHVDPTNDPAFEQDDSLILGPSEAVEPFSTPAKARQGDLFDL